MNRIAPMILLTAALLPAAHGGEGLEPWTSRSHPQDVARRHVQEIRAAKEKYCVKQAGTMDGANCRSPVGGGFAVWDQTWESNRAVRLENVGETDVINPWLSNGQNDFRSVKEIVAGALLPGMSDREKAIAVWRVHSTHRFHASTGDNEVNDPVKVFNVYGYTTCGNDSICLAGLWRAAGFPVRPARCVGHCISQVQFDRRWNLLDGDMGPFYLLRDNATIASEQDLVRDHDLVKRTHTNGVNDPDSRAAAESSAALFISDSEGKGTRDSVRDTTMNMVLRPNEAIVWRWGRLVPVKYHGRLDIGLWGPRSGDGKVWGAQAADRICNGRWEYLPDFTRELWRKGVERADGVKVESGELVPEDRKTGTVVWKMHSPYPFVGGKLDVEGTGAQFSVSWDGTRWIEVADGLEALFHFPHKGDARYEYRLKCELPAGSRLKRLGILNDLQMAPLALPGMVVGENQFSYSDESIGARKVRVVHEWVERSLSRPPPAPPGPLLPEETGTTEGTDIVFKWKAPSVGEGERIADYHFELSERADLAWPLSANFEKLISNTANSVEAQYRLPYVGLLTPGQKYWWRVRARNDKGVWGPWSKAWCFTPGGPVPPLSIRLEGVPGNDGQRVLRWEAGGAGRKVVSYRVYGSDEKGFTVSDEPYTINVGCSRDVPARAPANFVGETERTELVVLGPGVKLPNANKAYYRVVAIDDKGKRSGPSDYATAPRPFLHGQPAETARVGAEYRGRFVTIRSLGDLRLRTVDGKQAASFWDVEKPRFVLGSAPSWLRLDESTGVLSGVPDAAGTADVVITVTLERSVRRLDDGRLSWGHEQVLEVGNEKVGSATQRLRITVAP
jgi:hypothetical protein